MEKKILVVDDDSDIAELVKLVLETENFSVKTVLDSSIAVDSAKEYQPDLILLDITMPGIDGWEIFKRLRKDKVLKKIPIAIFSAKSEEFDTMIGLHVMKADAYITKPFGKQELIDKVSGLVAK
jgi:two-component system response regulator VicR